MTPTAPFARAFLVCMLPLLLGLPAASCGGPDFIQASPPASIGDAAPDAQRKPIVLCDPCPPDTPPPMDAGTDGDATVDDAEDSAGDGGDTGILRDATLAGDGSERGDAGLAPPPPVTTPGKAGFDLAAGGNVSSSAKYKLVGVVGEGPGGNVIAKSASYTLKGGVVAATQ
jgi:hypothetical protein